MTDNQPLSVNQLNTMTTVTILPTDYDEIQRPAPRRGLVEVAKEASTGDNTIEKCLYEVLDNNTVPAGNTLSLMSALYLWATLGCGVFGCHGNLV